MAHLVHSVFHNGYHPVSDTIITLDETQHLSNCSLYLYLFLSPLIFVDPYELVHYEASYTFRHWGTSNLELPIGAVSQDGSHLLLNVHRTDNKNEIHVKLPLHLRYGNLSEDQLPGYHTADLAWPAGFFECPLSDALSIPSSGLPRLPSEVSSLFDLQSAYFISIEHRDSGSPDLVRVPTGTLNDLAYVEFGTLFTIWAAFFYLLKSSLSAFYRINRDVLNKRD
ncbi:Protein PBN1 [Termitomyces sp. T112]|nr:Protein PBN1 [Termitomyces sp. T112]KAH0585691.1 hypothetical protein H2248_008904 [Termitomyces sp. 'cryptogamus']KNZ80809.1 Protein PBN1 [Termitomyces sp. J132]